MSISFINRPGLKLEYITTKNRPRLGQIFEFAERRGPRLAFADLCHKIGTTAHMRLLIIKLQISKSVSVSQLFRPIKKQSL